MKKNMRTKQIIELLNKHGDLTGGQIKSHLDQIFHWGGGSINSVVMLCRCCPLIEKKYFDYASATRETKRIRQQVWGLK